MSTRSLSLRLSLLLVPVLAAPALCQSTLSNTEGSTVAITPSTGLWWSPGENGQFMQLDVGPGGYAFATLADGNADGTPSYSVLQGQLLYADAGRPGDGLAVLESTRYQIDHAGCLDCGVGGGQTRAPGPVLALRFIDATHAVLLAETGQIRRYERFPLYTRAADLSSARYANRSFLLSSYGTGAPPLQARVQLVDAAPDSRCDSPGLGGTDTRNLQFTFPDDPQSSTALARQFGTTRLLIGPGVNPRLDLKAFLTYTRQVCYGPPGFCSNPGAFHTETRELCLSTYLMHEVDDGLRGAAPPHSGAEPLPANQYGPARFSGGLSLLPLPDTAAGAGIPPSRGLWWSVGENGHFMQLDIGPGGYALATLTEGGTNGRPNYQVLQGELQQGDASISGGMIATLASPLYRLIGAGCLTCGHGAGQTVATGHSASLRFVDGTHAQLLGESGEIRRYERFPLYIRSVDTTAERVADGRFLLSAQIEGQRRSEVVRLRAIAADPACDSPGFELARNYALVFEDLAASDSALAQRFATARLQITPGANPRIDLKAMVPEVDNVCRRPVALFCVPNPPLTGRSLCRSIYTMHEVDADLRGAAPIGSGSAATSPTLPGPTRIVATMALQALPPQSP